MHQVNTPRAQLVPEPRAPDFILGQGKAQERETGFPHERQYGITFSILIILAKALPPTGCMTVKRSDTRLCCEGAFKNPVQVLYVNGNIAVQLPVI